MSATSVDSNQLRWQLFNPISRRQWLRRNFSVALGIGCRQMRQNRVKFGPTDSSLTMASRKLNVAVGICRRSKRRRQREKIFYERDQCRRYPASLATFQSHKSASMASEKFQRCAWNWLPTNASKSRKIWAHRFVVDNGVEEVRCRGRNSSSIKASQAAGEDFL
jgi:hypothetical protein